MSTLDRPCLDCGVLIAAGTRCVQCRRVSYARRSPTYPKRKPVVHERTTTERGYGADWKRIRPMILARDEHRCHYCGDHATSVDHLIPLSRGGTHAPGNLVAACVRCNSAKGDR